jgi:histidinol-phosphate phosphatase family protein
MRQAVILAGGKGTRLRERLQGRPKPLVDLCGVPLLERQVLLLKRYHFDRILILVNHAADQIIDFCRQKAHWGLDIQCVDDGEPLGTAGAVLAAYDSLESEFLVVYGDTMLNVDLDRFVRHFHARSEAAAALFLHPNDHPHDSDLVELDTDGYVREFHPYPHDPAQYLPNLVNAALYCVKREALKPWLENDQLLDFGKHLFPAMLREGMRLSGYISPEYIKDVGTPSRLDRACDDLMSGRIERASLSTKQNLVLLDRDGTINVEVEHLSTPDQLQLIDGVEAAIRALNQAEYRCCIVTNQPVVARGDCSFADLQAIHNKLETLLGREGAYVDRIYFCPHHPDKGFAGERPELKGPCLCRKPGTALVEQAFEDFNADPRRTWMIGDTSVDMATAEAIGIKSILVETGHAGLDYKTSVEPNYRCRSLPEAVQFVLKTYPQLLEDCRDLANELSAGDFVLIGGQSKAGKTTLAHLLRDHILERGGKAVVLSLDRWLLNQDQRGDSVLLKYDMDAVQTLVDDLVLRPRQAVELLLPTYHRLDKRRLSDVISQPVGQSDIILIEGTVSLAINTREYPTHRLHVEADETTRKDRFLQYYRARGLTDAQALTLYRERLQEEFTTVADLSQNARLFRFDKDSK